MNKEKVTLGGDRLGTGRKMTVYMRNFGRSSHDQGCVFTTDQAIGTLVPAYCQVATRGDTIYLDDITSLVRTLPTNGPVFGSFKQQIDVFCAPMRLYIGALHNNTVGIGLKMDQVKMPVMHHITTLYPDDLKLKNPNLASVSPTSLSAYLGATGSKGGINYTNQPYDEFGMFELFYWDVYKNYYANKQEEEGVVITGVKKTELLDSDVSGILCNLVANSQTSTANIKNNAFTQSVSIPLSQGTGKPQEGSKIANGTYLAIDETPKVSSLIKAMGVQTFGDKFVASIAIEGISKETPFVYVSEYNGKLWFAYRGGVDEDFTTEINTKISTLGIDTGENAITTTRFPLSNIDKMRAQILATPIGESLKVNQAGTDSPDGMLPYGAGTKRIIDSAGKVREARSQAMCGLGIKTHLSDMFMNWLQTDWLDGTNGINDITAIDTTSGSFSINEFLLDYKLFRMMNRTAVADGTYDGWQVAVFGTDGKIVTESPVYCGGYSAEIAFDEVVSTSAAESEPLGSLAGRGATQQHTRKGGRGIKIKCDEAMLVLVMVSFTPRVTYSQYTDWWMSLDNMDDLHKPDLDGIAFQDLNIHQMAAWYDTVNADGTITHHAVGKQPAWTEYTTNWNRNLGSFAAGAPLDYLVVGKRYTPTQAGYAAPTITSYIDPTEFNHIFADESLTALPFWVQIGFNETTRRVMAASQMPVL
ncbi:major capsid protein [Dipodfec virus UOA04_Rod_663]|nr:major capsid protein [Dipodfec virus UOA04_Rod_663]